jgi:heat shock protein HslJ
MISSGDLRQVRKSIPPARRNRDPTPLRHGVIAEVSVCLAGLLNLEDNMESCRPRRSLVVLPRLVALGLVALGLVVLGLAALGLAALAPPVPRALAQTFPFGAELMLDVNPMRGSKKVPILDIGARGAAEIELWCNSVKAQLIIAANTITIVTGEMSARQCAPERARADDELLAALNQVTNWRMEKSALVLIGGTTLRFRVQTN